MPSLDVVFLIIVVMALMSGYPVGLTLGGISILFAIVAWSLGAFDPALFSAIPSRLFGIMNSQVLLAIPLFVFMGLVLEKSGLAENMFRAFAKLLRHRAGGLTIAVTLVGMLMAASTGIVGASVVTLGLLALPAMLKEGEQPTLAAGSVAAAGTLGQIIPPSIVLIVLGDQMSNAYQKMQTDAGNFAPDTVSVPDLFAGALLPGLLLVALYLVWQVFAHKSVQRSERVPKSVQPEQQDSPVPLLLAILPPLVLILLVLGSILGGVATPSESAALGAVGALLLAARRGVWDEDADRFYAVPLAGLISLILLFAMRLVLSPEAGLSLAVARFLVLAVVIALADALITLFKRNQLMPVLDDSVHLISMIFLIVIGASIFSLVFRGLGGDATIASLLSDLPGGTWGALCVVMLILFVLGFFLEFIEITYVVVPLVAPVLLAMPMADGSLMNPVWLGVLIALNLQTSFLTPPFGVSLFYLRSVAPAAITTATLYRGVVPFVVLQLLALVIVMIFPMLVTWLPSLLYGS